MLNEVQTALFHIAGNKASGSSGILPELVKMYSDNSLEYLVKLFTHVSDSRIIPQNGKIHYLFLCQRRGICHSVTIGVASAF